MDCFKIFGEVGGRDRRCKRGEESSLPLRVQGKKMANSAIKMAPFTTLFFLMNSG